MNLLTRLKSGRLYLDGSTGTMLQAAGLREGEAPELWNLSHPDAVRGLHEAYFAAGSNIVAANTFGVNPRKYPGGDGTPGGTPSYQTLIRAAVSHARAAAGAYGGQEAGRYVALDVGPLGKLLAPLGELSFADAVDCFAAVIRCGAACGVDLILIETMNDAYETRAAVLAAKENCDLPIFVTNTYDERGRLMTGATPEAMVALLEGLRVDALGINCGLGADHALPVAEALLRCASIPVIVKPNAGLPAVIGGKTVFSADPARFAADMAGIAARGAAVLGGCCGTTPAHIRAMIAATAAIPCPPPVPKHRTVVSSCTHAVVLGEGPVLIGERINPIGKPTLARALREGDMDYILREGVSQKEAGVHVLDVNVGLPGLDETALLCRTVTELQAVTDLPLQLDTANPAAMEAALRICCGKPLLNSVNGRPESMAAVFPLAAKYGGVIIALTLDETGIPADADGRVAIARRIIAEAARYGISADDIVVDPLAMAVSADPQAAAVTLECVRRLHALGIRTSLGVSNISFGLPQRNTVNAAFFTMALAAGLDAAIVNPRASEMLGAYHAYRALTGLDAQCADYIGFAAAAPAAEAAAPAPADEETRLRGAVLRGLREEAADAAARLGARMEAMEIIGRCLIPALDEIGTAFEQKKAFLPQLLMSAEAAKAAFAVLREQMAQTSAARPTKYKIVLATVRGDIHDIGKNIVKTLLENYDYAVIDLGRDVPPERIVETVLREGAPLVGLSALMTTTVPAMEETIRLLRASAPGCRIVVGGAVLNAAYAERIGADKYARDAMETVRYAESLSGE